MFFGRNRTKITGFGLVVGLAAAAVAAGCSAPVSDLAADGSQGDQLALTDQTVDGDSADPAEPEPEREMLSAEEIEAFEMPPLLGVDEVSVNADSSKRDLIVAAATSPEVDILSTVAFDDTPTAAEIEAYGDGLTRTASGRLISLDSTAQVACANAEMALWAVDDGDEVAAGELLGRVVELIGESQSEGIAQWATTLDAEPQVDPVSLVGFIEACVDAGHDL